MRRSSLGYFSHPHPPSPNPSPPSPLTHTHTYTHIHTHTIHLAGVLHFIYGGCCRTWTTDQIRETGEKFYMGDYFYMEARDYFYMETGMLSSPSP